MKKPTANEARTARQSQSTTGSKTASATAAVKFLWSLPTDKVHITAIHPDRKRPMNIKGRTYAKTAAGRAQAQRWIEEAQRAGWGIYFNDNNLSVDLGAAAVRLPNAKSVTCG